MFKHIDMGKIADSGYWGCLLVGCASFRLIAGYFAADWGLGFVSWNGCLKKGGGYGGCLKGIFCSWGGIMAGLVCFREKC